jgi:molybdate transport system ATP-binding protein
MFDVAVEKRLGDFRLDAAFRSDAGVTALFGPSGSGKSSVVAAIAGLLRPDRGRIAVGNRLLHDSASGTDVPVHTRGVRVVFQESRLFPHFNVRQNLLYGRFFAGRSARTSLDEVTALLDLGGLLKRRPRTLSGGERQRVAIGRALLAAPQALLLDEPLASLDAERKAEVLPFLERLVARATIPILYVSHALEEIERLAATMVVLEQGRVIAVGPRDEIVRARGLMSASEQLEPFSVLAGKVLAYDVDNRMTRVAVGGHVLSAPGEIGASGAPIRLRVRARDVSIALTPPSAISIRNILPGVIAGIESGQGAEVEVMIDLGGHLPRLSARITRAACRGLGLATGTRVYALVKAVAVDRSA